MIWLTSLASNLIFSSRSTDSTCWKFLIFDSLFALVTVNLGEMVLLSECGDIADQVVLTEYLAEEVPTCEVTFEGCYQLFIVILAYFLP